MDLDTGASLKPRKSFGRPREADERAQVLLEKDVEERPSASTGQRRHFLEHVTATTLSDPTVRRLMKRMGFSQRTDSGGRWNETSSLGGLEGYAHRASRDRAALVFVDEMGTNTLLSALCGWAPKGKRAHYSVPRNRGANTTVHSSMSTEGMGASLTVEGATTSAVFESSVEQVLAPMLRSGQAVMDNLRAHKAETIKEMIEQRGCRGAGTGFFAGRPRISAR